MSLRATITLISLLVFVSVPALADKLPVEYFSRLPLYTKPNLSPDGKQVVYLYNVSDTQGQSASILTYLNVTNGEHKYLVFSDNEEVKVNWFTWANDQKLIVSTRQADRRGTTKTTETRLFSVDITEEKPQPVQLIKPRSFRNSQQHNSQFQDDIIDFLVDDPDHVLISLDLDTPALPSVYKLNINNRKLSRMERGKRKIRSWGTDQQGHVRYAKTLDYKSGESKLLVRRTVDGDWHTLFEYNALEDAPIYAQGFGLDPNVLYYKAYEDDKLALFKVDLTSLEHELVFRDPDYDFDGSLLYSRKTRDIIGISHSQAKSGRIYWDEDRDLFHRSLSAALPDTDNYLVDFSRDENTYLLYSENDYTPGTYYLGLRKERQLGLLFEQYPELGKSAQVEHQRIEYTARDGVTIEGYLSVPDKAQEPLPTILFPHGGPGARDYAGFDYWTSFFVSRGYAVLRPNFRGSTGYGYEFAKSQMGSWGLAMQDDLTDAVHWLVEQGVADKEKVCIVGASYGGYAAAMGITKEPDLFACAVSFAGVTDLEKLLSTSRRYLNKKFVKNQIGSDSDDLERRSPVNHADKVKTPILLVHGNEDRVVDVRQSHVMVEALKDEGKPYQYLELENGDHYLSIQRNRHAFFRAMDEFLQKHLL